MRRLGRLLACATMWLWLTSSATAQESAAPEQRLSQERLDELVSPIALYPDVLLSQVLNAATYPEDLSEAASWSADHATRRGEAALAAVMSRPWDASVKSLVPYPKVLASLSARQEWAAQLARAFLGDEQRVLESIQKVRRKAYAEGGLKGMRVERRGEDLVIHSATELPPRLVYGGFDWRSRQTHIVSIRMDWLGHGALLAREDEAGARTEATKDDATPIQRAYVKPPPLVSLAAPSARVPDTVSRDRGAPAQAHPVSLATLPRPTPLVGLGGPQKRELPTSDSHPAGPSARAETHLENALITLMPRLLDPGTEDHDGPSENVPQREAPRSAPDATPAALPPRLTVTAKSQESPQPSTTEGPALSLMPTLLNPGADSQEPSSKPVASAKDEGEAGASPAASAGVGATSEPSAAPTAMLRQRGFRTFIGAADRRTLDSLGTALRR